MVLSLVAASMKKVFGSRNDRMVKAYYRRVATVNELEAAVRKLSDQELRTRTQEFTTKITGGATLLSVLPEAMATAREVMDRSVGIRSIFSPEHKFDPSQLPADARKMYDDVQAKIAATQPVQVLGCIQSPQGIAHLWDPVPAWMHVEIPTPLYEAVRKLYPQSRPPFRCRPFDVQLIGGMVLGEGKIAEMRTGEGKTIVGPLACYLAAIQGHQVHVVTVNDYLVQRDRDWVFPFYFHLGLSVGAIHPFHMQPTELKQQAYMCNVVYGTNSEFGFDYLRDNMKTRLEEQVQRKRDFCIIDEVDSILIDEARTPLIISGSAHEGAPPYDLADKIARHLLQRQKEWNTADERVQQTIMRIKGYEGDIRNARDKEKIPAMKEAMNKLRAELPELERIRDEHTQFYEVEREKKAAHLTHEGVAEAQKAAQIGSFYVGSNMDFPHLLENALRAHVVYHRDKDYVVQKDEVIIVDEFTGRLMVGRQWSDGLHQAVEQKEKVKVKEETQTMATVTIQNFFKLYKKLAGMTGTAMTEATEFHDIYKLDVVAIPTNVPVIRIDRDDLVFTSTKDKWNSILDEIKKLHDVGRPVLVGTTSVENSEMLSAMLTKKHGVKHEVLNAKQHEREAHIVAHAGELGAVMIATNMAGRGTDIKLQPIDRAAVVRHWQLRNLLPRDAKPEMSDEELVRMSFRHQARFVLGLKPADVEKLYDDEVKLRLLRQWVIENCPVPTEKANGMTIQQCMDELDEAPYFLHHRLKLFTHVEQMGGLHIVGTERHEARRIDNQLRGRAGRQGDRGSSRFFISLEDDLMKMFAGPKTLALLSRFGMKEGDAIEHRMITRSVERAQRKVEERNYEIRKNLLEYDEVMEHQRNGFYGVRQEVLEGRHVERIVFGYITDAVDDAVEEYLAHDYVANQIAEWCRNELRVAIDAAKLDTHAFSELEKQIRAQAHDEVRQTVEVTIGEYMDKATEREDWDLRGLQQWAMSQFSVDLKINQLRQMTPEQVAEMLTEHAQQIIDRKDLTGLQKFLVKNFAQADLAAWANDKFDIKIDPESLLGLEKKAAADFILEKARAAYLTREVRYPIDFMLDMTFHYSQQSTEMAAKAAENLAAWANQRYGLKWTAETISKTTFNELADELIDAATNYLAKGGIDAEVDKALTYGDAKSLSEWATKRFGQPVPPSEFEDPTTRREVLIEKFRNMLRQELTYLERYVLLQILDTSWKDHLYAMDQAKDAVGLRAYAEKDPRIEYKRLGSENFEIMRKSIRDQVTGLIFRARMSPGGASEVRNVWGSQQAVHEEAKSVLAGAAVSADDGEPRREAGGEESEVHQSRKQRRAAEAMKRKGR